MSLWLLQTSKWALLSPEETESNSGKAECGIWHYCVIEEKELYALFMSRRLGLMLTSEKKVASKHWLSALPCKKGFWLKLLAFESRRGDRAVIYTKPYSVCVELYKIEGEAGIAPRRAASAHSGCGQDVSSMLPCNELILICSRQKISLQDRSKQNCYSFGISIGQRRFWKAEEFSLNHSIHPIPSLCNHCRVLGLDELILWLLSSYGSPTSRVCPVRCCGRSWNWHEHPAQAATKSHCKVTQMCWDFWVLVVFWLFSKETRPGWLMKFCPSWWQRVIIISKRYYVPKSTGCWAAFFPRKTQRGLRQGKSLPVERSPS